MTCAQLILWDLDGTLLRAGGVSRDAFSEAVGGTIEHPVERIDFAGRTDPWIARALLEQAGRSAHETSEILARYAEALVRRSDQVAREGRVLPRVHETLAAMADAQVRQGVVTGNLGATARVKVTALGLAQHLDLAASAYGDDGPTRDHLVPIALARAGGVAPEATWVVGDTPYDLQCARAAGTRCLLVATGGYDLATLQALDADAVLPDLTNAADVLLG